VDGRLQGGPATEFGDRAQPGDPLLLLGPNKALTDDSYGGIEFRPSAASRIVLAGDETAAPAICAILESLPANVTGHALIEVPETTDILGTTTRSGISVQWLTRGTAEHGSLLRLEVESSIPVQAATFRKDLKSALQDAYPTKDEGTLASSYQALEALVSALSDPGLSAWRSTVLDVRQHVVISCNEHKPNGEVETGLEPGTLSGGEGQRFTSFIMGAALAYQLGFATAGFTSFGTVMIDEAFIQANSEYAAAGIRALQEFGFHLVLAAPEDKIDLSRHLGSITDIIKHPGSNISGFVTTGRSPAMATTITLR